MSFSSTQIIQALFLSFLAGISTSIGALIVLFFNKDNLRILSFGLGFSAGIMIYISFMELLPQAIADLTKIYAHNGTLLGILGFFGGIFIAGMIDKFVPEEINPHEPISANPSLLKRTGILTAIVISIHNFPEGFATFAAVLDNLSFGILIAVAVAIHNIPEGISVALPIYHANGSKKQAIIYASLSGLSEPIGAIIGAFLLFPFLNEITIGLSFAIIAGIMVFISLDELIPSARIYGKSHDSLYGLFLGMFVMAMSLFLLNY